MCLNNMNTQDYLLNLNLCPRDEALVYLDERLLDTYDITRKTIKSYEGSSEHLVVMAAIAKTNNHKIKRILEIGTHKCVTARVLLSLFPEAKITTIDLSFSEIKSAGLNKDENYLHEELLSKDFHIKRLDMIEELPNLEFIEMNSINLINWTPNEFDLIFIDGDHSFPIACIDIINAYKLLNSSGYMIVDDIWTDKSIMSTHSYEVLNVLNSCGLFSSFAITLKRVEIPQDKKYIVCAIK